MVFPTTSETLRPQDPVAQKKNLNTSLKICPEDRYFFPLHEKNPLEFVLKAIVTSLRSEFLGDSNTKPILFIGWIYETEHTLSSFKDDSKLGEAADIGRNAGLWFRGIAVGWNTVLEGAHKV